MFHWINKQWTPRKPLMISGKYKEMQSKPGLLKNREEPGELCIQGFSLKQCTFLIFILANSKQLERITWIFQIVICLHLIKFNSFQKDSTFYLPIALLQLISSCPFYSLPILLLPDWLFHFINKKQRTKDNTIGKVQKSYLFSLIDFRTKKRGNEDTTWEVYILCLGWSASSTCNFSFLSINTMGGSRW